MKPRMETLPGVADRPGYLVLDVPGKGAHHFRLPSLSRAMRISELWRERGGTQAAKVFEMAGVVIGASWRHETLEMDAQFPADTTTDALVAYSEAVQLELEEAGYTASSIAAMGGTLAQAMRARLNEDSEAQKLAGFSGPATDDSTSRSSSLDSSSRGTRKRPTAGRPSSG